MFDQYGFMYILDNGNSRILKWYPGMSYGTVVVSATMSNPNGMQFDYSNNIVIAETSNQRIISFNNICRKFIELIYEFSIEKFCLFFSSSTNNYSYCSLSKYISIENLKEKKKYYLYFVFI